MARNLTKFKDRSKGDKVLRVVNLTLAFAQFFACVGLLIWNILRGDPNNRIFVTIVVAFADLFPLLVELISGKNLPPVLFLGIEIYLIFAGLWGSALNGYYEFNYLDCVVHFVMGYLLAMIGIFVIARLGNYKKMSPWLIILFCVFFSLAIELVWELCEWTVDNFAGQTAQGIPQEGMSAPFVTDTMADMLCNFSGAMLFLLHFVLGKFAHLPLGINAIEFQLAKGQTSSIQRKTDVSGEGKEFSTPKDEDL